MKKLVLSLAIIATSTFTYAQEFGLKAGMNVSSLSKDESLSDQKSKIGFNAGVFANFAIAEDFSIQPEVMYTQYGSKVEDMSESSFAGITTKYESSYSINLDYIAVPLMFQYKATPSFYLEAGPEFGFLMSAKQKGDETTTVTSGGTTSTENKSFSYDMDKDELNTFNIGVGLGAGYFFTDNIGLTARYVAGFTDVAKENSGDAIKNNVFQVGLAFKF